MTSNLGESLHRFIHCYKTVLKNTITSADLGLQISHIRALKCINKTSNCSAQAISQKMMLDKSQVTRIIKELMTKGHIEKYPNPDNYRSQLLILTQTGQKILRDIAHLEDTTSKKMTAGLTDQQIQEFEQLVDIMMSNLRKP